jgi:hypothetical protein
MWLGEKLKKRKIEKRGEITGKKNNENLDV